ncbi:hypothetical protein HCN_1857 [Helicobacter cinaedi PAGU611]|uniref:Uncharacterized protein n=1 Tax=Helicobacter cinaedi CCUG 18818 = ATCC BAA-847 TaxID=537971 RepID=A0AAI8QI29_9HELI|nr:hypothetical protein [Helicobacter cinaedi]AWK62454.1 hypothetical protein C6B36_08985 [Helicobacter cinaedi]EFR45993.1 hypothetical protein HCCG_00539 [Helicobacter cinaedi CCUG 18818 = ATCC BAA-847]QOQ90750.1 hypothetical protein HW260_11200 [Helicobacter cinaedi]QOQ96910.1 hypothetical protein HW245_04530 [Helicobacter cinaedi]BAM13018.1 hypothetical protein HCN_1857 [Helicobacter cinaedi PAGU611]
MKYTQQDMARIIDVTPKTLRNWRKHKPELYKRVLLSFKYDEIIEDLQKCIKELQSLELKER